jgi:hypothetical protein
MGKMLGGIWLHYYISFHLQMYKKRLKTNRINQLLYYDRLYLPAFKIRRDIKCKSMSCGEFSKNGVASGTKLCVIRTKIKWDFQEK